MNPTPSEQTLFAEALRLATPEARAAYLEQACGDNAALRRRVEYLLRAAEAAVDFLEEPPIDLRGGKGSEEGSSALHPGDRIGRYKLLEIIGEGGFGVVYMAEQEEPVRRRVALKIIKPGMDSKQVIARFEAERQALALMDHPNIAKVLDGGSTESGRPYFVMELVRGIRITDYCDENFLSTEERLLLFIRVCQAVQHAHQKGIIHRDIKPSNILVTVNDGVEVPKVIDFGIAKAMGQRLTDKTLFTQFHAFMGTPAYTSPEQAEMSSVDVDTRSDIYSLGVLLYELLTGRAPFDSTELLSAGLDEMRRIIRQVEPPRPSTRLSTLGISEATELSRKRQLKIPELANLLRGELDWVVMRCLEKDRSRRYETASSLAADIQRHLRNEPVTARPASAAYRFQKTFRRNKLMFGAGIAVVLSLVAGLSLAIIGWRQTRVERDRAIQARAGEEAQRKVAQVSEQAAKLAEAGQSHLREQAEAQALAERRNAYASDMNLAQQALFANRLGRLQELLDRQRPPPGQKDLRGWEWRYLWQYCSIIPAFTLPQTSNSVWTLSASGDGRWLAVGDYENGGLSVWDLSNRREKARLPAGNGNVHVAFSPTAPLLAYSTVEGSRTTQKANIRLRDVTTDRDLGELPLGAPCVGLEFSANGQTLVSSTAAPENQITIWRITDQTRLASYRAPQNAADEAIPFAITPDASLAAYGSPTIHLLDLVTGQERWQARAASDHVMALTFSPDGKILASSAGYAESAIRLWEVASGKDVARLQAHGGWISSLAFWPDGRTLASASADGTIRIWNLSQLTNVPPPRVAGIHKNEVARLALLPDHTRVISGDIDGSIRAWDIAEQGPQSSPIKLPVLLGGAWHIAPDGQSLLTVAGGRVARWSGANFQQMEQLMVVGNSPYRRDYLFSQEGQFLAVVSTNGSVRVWDLARRKVSYQLRCTGVPSPVAFRSGDQNLVVADQDGETLQEWNLTTGQETRSWPKPVAGLRGAGEFAFSPDDRWLLCMDDGGTSTLHDLIANRATHPDLFVKHPEQMAFSPDSRFFALANQDKGKAKMWETDSLRPVMTLEAGGHALSFSPDGERVALGGTGKKAVSIRDTAGGRQLLDLDGEADVVWWCEFSSDGNTIGALNGRGVLLLWRAPSWKEITTAEAKERSPAEQP